MSSNENTKQALAKRRNKLNNTAVISDYNYVSNEKTDFPAVKMVCASCGEEFEQNYMPRKKIYSNYKNCIECRRKKIVTRRTNESKSDNSKSDSIGKKEKILVYQKEYQVNAATIEIDFEPHSPMQKVIMNDALRPDIKYMIINAGNRWGKDYTTNRIGLIYFIRLMNEQHHLRVGDARLEPSLRWWLVAPDDTIGKNTWKEIKAAIPKELIVKVSESEWSIDTICGGIIEVKSAYDPEKLVSVGLDLVTITEAAKINNKLPVAWANLTSRVTSLYRGLDCDRINIGNAGCGKIIANSTPMGKNYFYDLFLKGQKNSKQYSSNYISYQIPWTENPDMAILAKSTIQTNYGPITYEQDLINSLGMREYEEKYLASFVSKDGSVFKDFEEKCVINYYQGEYAAMPEKEKSEIIKEIQRPKHGRMYRLSWDIATGSSGDSSNVIILDRYTRDIVQLIKLNNKNYTEQYDTIAMLSREYNNAPCVFSKTGHTAVVGELLKRGVCEIVLDENKITKGMYVQLLERAVQNGYFKLHYNGGSNEMELIFQMGDYTENSGKYSNTGRNHDDWVSALYLMFYDYEKMSRYTTFIGETVTTEINHKEEWRLNNVWRYSVK